MRHNIQATQATVLFRRIGEKLARLQSQPHTMRAARTFNRLAVIRRRLVDENRAEWR